MDFKYYAYFQQMFSVIKNFVFKSRFQNSQILFYQKIK